MTITAFHHRHVNVHKITHSQVQLGDQRAVYIPPEVTREVEGYRYIVIELWF